MIVYHKKKKVKVIKDINIWIFFPLKSLDNNRGEQKNRKKKLKKPNHEKKPIKIFKKPTGSVQFWFYKLETEKTEPNQTQTRKNRKKTESNQKNELKQKNRAKPV